tara:strand:- start:41 stop:292 length:252 start_codon:yes stop_codon:yes gene_type:complete
MELKEDLGVVYTKSTNHYVVKLDDGRNWLVVYVEDDNGGGIDCVFEVDDNNNTIKEVKNWQDFRSELYEIYDNYIDFERNRTP